MTAVTEVAIGNGNFLSRAGCKNPRQPGSSPIPTKGIIIRNPSGIIYHGEPLGVPQHNANIKATVQNKAVTKIAVNGFGVYMIRLKYSFTFIFSVLCKVINNAINGVGVEKNIPRIAYIIYPTVSRPVFIYEIEYGSKRNNIPCTKDCGIISNPKIL